MIKDNINPDPMTVILTYCPDCDGTGWVEVEIPRPHAGGFNEGYIDTSTEECETCWGSGEIPKTCLQCDGEMVVADGDDDYCADCRNDD